MVGRIGMLGGALVISCLAATAFARAETVSFADAASMLAKECGADIKKFCKGLNLGNNAIRNCLDGNQASVSPTCTSTLVAVTDSIERRLAAQASVMKVCSGNAKTFCEGVKGEVYILQCLVKTERIDSAKCNEAITDSGWR